MPISSGHFDASRIARPDVAQAQDESGLSGWQHYVGITTAGAKAIIDLTALPAGRDYALRVHQNGVITSWDVRLEVELKRSFVGGGTEILAHTNVDGNGVTKFVTGKPAKFMRVRVAALVLGVGSSIDVQILALP